ncbi:MAG: hypothetical protein P8Z81_15335 [Deinococcales bacterium]
MSKETIRAFLEEMRKRYQKEIDAVSLPDGTDEYVADRVAQDDRDTLMFMLKLGYLMGLQTGFAAGRGGEDAPSGPDLPGPLQA